MKLYTDGAATMRKINGEYVREAGGWAFAFIENDTLTYFNSGHKDNTTNNEMELTAIYEGLKYFANSAAPAQQLEVYSDSAYCINIYTQWAAGWQKRGWTRKGNQPIENLELIKKTWQLLEQLNNKFYDIKFIKVKGHSTNKWNNYVDKMAVNAKENFITNTLV